MRTIAAAIAALCLTGTAPAAVTPPVKGGHLEKPFTATLNGKPFLCRAHLYTDGLILRCVRLPAA